MLGKCCILVHFFEPTTKIYSFSYLITRRCYVCAYSAASSHNCDFVKNLFFSIFAPAPYPARPEGPTRKNSSAFLKFPGGNIFVIKGLLSASCFMK